MEKKEVMKNKSYILLGVLGILVIISMTSFVNAEMLVSDANVSYDSEILDRFQSSEWVDVLVDLKDYSNITVTGNKEERKELSRQRDIWFKPKIDEAFAALSEDEFNLVRKTSRGFRGEVTKKGLDKLINDTRISAVYFNGIVGEALDSENETITENNKSISPNIKKEGFWFKWWWMIILIGLFVIGYIIIKRKG